MSSTGKSGNTRPLSYTGKRQKYGGDNTAFSVWRDFFDKSPYFTIFILENLHMSIFFCTFALAKVFTISIEIYNYGR